MVIYLFLHGIGIFLFGIFAAPITQYMMKLFCIVLGAYFAYGGSILLKCIKKGELKGIDY